MGVYALFFFIPALVAIGVAKLYFHWKYTWGEFFFQMVGTAIVIFSLFFIAGESMTYDTKFVNGVVTKLDPVQKSCPTGWHDYTDSFCTEYRTRTVRDGQTCTTINNKRSCSPKYKTQYRYIYDWERRYFVDSDIKYRYEISRVDGQGVTIPPRFAEIKIGDAVATQVGYTNYIKGAADSLFAEGETTEVAPIAYPEIRDYYRADRVIITGYPADNALFTSWNKSLSEVNANIRKTGANAIVVVTGNPESFATELARAWEAHNINDVVIVIGMSGKDIGWVDVRSWSDDSLVNIEIRDRILALKTLDSTAINAIIEGAIKEHYVLQKEEDFDYLADDMVPPTWVLILAAILLLVATPYITYMFHKHDVF